MHGATIKITKFINFRKEKYSS